MIYRKVDVYGTACLRMTNEELVKEFIQLAITDVEDDVEKTTKIHKVCDEIVHRFVIEHGVKITDMDERIIDRFFDASNNVCYKLDSGKCIAVDEYSSNGYTMKAWECDEYGMPLDKSSFKVEEVSIPFIIDDEGTPLQYELIGFNIKH